MTGDSASIGDSLFRLINGTGGQMQKALRQANAEGEPLYLYLDIPFELNALPFTPIPALIQQEGRKEMMTELPDCS